MEIDRVTVPIAHPPRIPRIADIAGAGRLISADRPRLIPVIEHRRAPAICILPIFFLWLRFPF